MSNDADLIISLRRLVITGLAICIGFFGVFGVAGATIELAGAVIANGRLVVETKPKKVQHLNGGTVGEIFVTDGQRVEAGDVLVRLDGNIARAAYGVVRSQLDELLSRQARLMSERDESESITFPEELMAKGHESTVATSVNSERQLFTFRRNALTGMKAQLSERIAQAEEEIRGLLAQRTSAEQQIIYIKEELAGVAELWEKGLVSRQRLSALQREESRLSGVIGQYTAEIARARGRIAEINVQIAQQDQTFRTEVMQELRDVQGKIAELRERVVAAEDAMRRIEIRAPQSGTVNNLSIHTIGGIVGAGETLMEIVPDADRLIVEARVAPRDIDQVRGGAGAKVRILAGNQRTTPEFPGTVVNVPADLTREKDETGQARDSYSVTVLIDAPTATPRAFELRAGMPAEVHIETYARTPLEYLIKPLKEQLARTFRER